MKNLTADIDGTLNARIVRLAGKMSLINLRRTLRPAGLLVQEWRALVDLIRLERAHLRELARVSGADASHLSRVLKAMEAKGLIERAPDETDARRVVFSATAAGLAIFEQLRPEAEAVGREFSSIFTAKEREALEDLLDRADRRADDLLD